MKKSINRICFAIGCLALTIGCILACSKDFEEIILDDFDFSFTEEHQTASFVFEPNRTSFSLSPEKEILTTDYFVRYAADKGKGYFLSMEGDTLRERDTLLVIDKNWSYNYVAIDTGAHRIKVTAWDSNSRKKELQLDYTVRYASFEFLLNKGRDAFVINSKNPVTATLLRDKTSSQNETTEDFVLTYQIEDGSGQLFIGDTAYGSGEEFTVPKGVLDFDYQPETLGDHKLIMTAKAPDGAKITRELLLSVGNLNFSFRATAGSSQVELNTNVPINIDLQTQDEASEVTYTISHAFSARSEGAGTVRDQNGGVMEPGNSRNINSGNYNFTFQDDELGQRKIYFDLRDSNGQVKRDSVEIEVANIPFTFSGNSESNQVVVNQRTQLNFNIKSTGNTANIEYFLIYNIIEGNGKLTGVNGNNIQNNTDYPVNLGNFALFYSPESLGDHTIEFLVMDNFGQPVGPVTIDLTAQNLDIEFNASANNEDILVDQRGSISLNLIEKGDYDGAAYELSYFISGGDGQLFNGNSRIPESQYFTVVPGSFSYDFVGQQAGTYQITFLLRDSNGQILPEEQVTIVVGNNDFTLTMTPQKPTEFSNIPVNLVVDIDEVPQGANDSYEAFFSSNRNGSIQLNGANYGPGEKFPLVPGTNIISYTGTEPEAHNLVLSVKSGSDVTRTAEATIAYQQVDFTFTGGTQKSDISVGEITSLNFNISESVGSSDYTLRFTMDGNALIKDSNSNTVSPGNIYDVPKGNFNWSLEGTDQGRVTVTFFAVNDTGLEKSVTIVVNVEAKNYTFTASAIQSDANTGDIININFNISELGIGGDTYEMYFSSSGNNGTFEYADNTYSAGESFSVPVGAFSGKYQGLTEGNHNVVFTVRSSSDVEKTDDVSIDFETYTEPFDLVISQAPGDRLQGEEFNVAVILNANASHDPSVNYQMTFGFSGNRAGYFLYNGTRYDEGQTVPLNYASSNLTFYPETEETFTISFTVENTTGITNTGSTFVETIRKPVAQVKGEKHNVSCGGLNGCDYQVRIYTCFDIACSEAYSGATLNQVEIRIFNRKDNRWDIRVFNYNEARGNGADRYFLMEEEGKENDLRYLDQDFEVRVRDSNNQWSERFTGRVVRV